MDSFGDTAASMRERELELEVARLNAELESMRGEGEPTDIAARFLAMAASTVDLAMEEARREADELATEISAEAEARRDEATRLAEEAAVRAETLREQADQSETVVRQAEQSAEEIRAAAEREAEELVTTERVRLADELEVLSEVRTALEEERNALESYHEELQRRVQELAESMVAFMTTEPPLGAVPALDDLAAPELGVPEAVDADEAAAEPAEMADQDDEDAVENEDTDLVEPTVAEDGSDDSTEDDEPAEIAFVDYVIEPADEATDEATDEVTDELTDELAPEPPEVPQPAPAPPSFHDMMAAPPADEFGGVPVVDDPADAEPAPKRSRGGLFGRATDDEQEESAGLFGAHGARLIEQTSPEDLAAALADEDAEDERFRSFIDGDDADDKSRDWLLRPEQL